MASWTELEAAVARRVQGERLAHIHRVVETARQLSLGHGASVAKAEVAALLHDYAKHLSDAELLAEARRYQLITDPAEEAVPQLLHGPVGAALVQAEGLADDPEILDAIRWHTTGRAGMSLLDKVIWLADYIEPGRNFPGVDAVRSLAAVDLDQALLLALDQTLLFVIQRGWMIHMASVHTRNWLLRTPRRPQSDIG